MKITAYALLFIAGGFIGASDNLLMIIPTALALMAGAIFGVIGLYEKIIEEVSE